jgi:hypothetical protein
MKSLAPMWFPALFPDVSGDIIQTPMTRIQTRRQRHEDLPAQAHDLVIAIAREGGANPEEEEQEAAIFAASQWKPSGRKPNGDSQPPRKKIDVIAEIKIMLAYSARKNIAKAMPEYSTMWPATISDSPSTTSNGARLVSATPEIR